MQTPLLGKPLVEHLAPTPFVTASAEEIRRAQELREWLKQAYPNKPTREVPAWSVGVD